MASSHAKELILWFDEIGIEDVPSVGGKNASLGEMHQKLTANGVAVPNGYAIILYSESTSCHGNNYNFQQNVESFFWRCI